MQIWNMLHVARWLYRTQKIAKNSPSGHHRTTLSGYIFATKARIDDPKKNLLSSNISSTCPNNMLNFGSQAAEIVLLVWGTPANFNGFCILASLLQIYHSTEANQTLHDVWPSPELLHYIHFRGLLPRNGISPGAKFTLRRSLAFSYTGNISTPHSSSGRQQDFAAWCKEWNYGTFARRGVTDIRLGGHHVGHRPTLYFLKNIVMLCVVLCFSAYVVNKVHDNEHCSCSEWAVCDVKRGRFAIHCFGTMLKVEGLEKRLGLGLARSRSRSHGKN